MTNDQSIYTRFVGFRTDSDLHARLERFSRSLGRRRSDVARYLLLSCLNNYEGNREAIEKIRQAMY